MGRHFHIDRNNRICLFCVLNENRLLLEDEFHINKLFAQNLPRYEVIIYIVGIRETVSYKLFIVYFSPKVYV